MTTLEEVIKKNDQRLFQLTEDSVKGYNETQDSRVLIEMDDLRRHYASIKFLNEESVRRRDDQIARGVPVTPSNPLVPENCQVEPPITFRKVNNPVAKTSSWCIIL